MFIEGRGARARSYGPPLIHTCMRHLACTGEIKHKIMIGKPAQKESLLKNKAKGV
jgi:hypothetical protein